MLSTFFWYSFPAAAGRRSRNKPFHFRCRRGSPLLSSLPIFSRRILSKDLLHAVDLKDCCYAVVGVVEWLVVSVQALDREVGAVLAVLSEKAPGEGIKDSGFPRCVGSCDRCAVAEVDGLICCSFEVQDLQLFDFLFSLFF